MLYAEALLLTNYGCRLPCFWGITPGKTPWSEAQHFLEAFAQVKYHELPDEPFSVGSVLFFVSEEVSFTGLEHWYIIRDGIVESIEAPLPLGDFDAYSLSTFLETYGPPEEVWISTYSTEYKGFLPFLTILFYPQQGILAGYGPSVTYISDGKVWGCRNDITPSSFGLWSPEHTMTFEEAADQYRLQLHEEGVLFLPLSEATDMDEEGFYQTFKDPNADTCIQTPMELWPVQF